MFSAHTMRFVTASFDPRSLSPALWLDGADASTLYDATTGGSLVAPDGSIARWEDKSGNSRHATQGTVLNRPQRKTAIQNGRDAVRFDGANDWLAYPSTLFTYTGAATVFAVTKNIATEANGYASVIAEFGGTSNSIGCQTNRFPNAEFRPCTDVFAPGGIEHGANYTAADPHLIVWQWSNWSTHKTNGNTLVRVDGIAGTPTAYGANPAGFTSTTRAIGRNPDTSFSASSFLAADIAEIIVLSYAATTDQRQQVERYLATKWGVTI